MFKYNLIVYKEFVSQLMRACIVSLPVKQLIKTQRGEMLSLKTPSKFSSVQSLSRVQLFVTPWAAPRQASLSITNSWSSLKPMSIE